MDYLAAGAAMVLVILLVFHHLVTMKRRQKLPPGPYAYLPIVGNILQLLGRNPHESLANLSKTYGPLMSLLLGSQYTIVVSSPQGAKKVFQEHDQTFCSHAVATATGVHDYNKNSVALLPVGDRWRKTRKLCREHLFSSRRLDESQGLRREKLTKLHDYLQECSTAGRAVDVGEAVFVTLVNLITFTLFSVDFASFDADHDHVTQDLRETVEGAVVNLTSPNVADYIPLVKWIDPQGLKRRSKFYTGKLFEKFEDIINSRLESPKGSLNKYDLLETLVKLMDDTDYNLTIDDMKHLFLDLFLGGSHTTPSAVESAMRELLLNPTKMGKLKSELTNVIGKNKQVEESDISGLPYLQAVIKETLRLHPPAPLLFSRRSGDEVEINGYTIPQNSQVFVNAWAIGRDPTAWPNPDSFEPERFFTNKIDYKGQDFALVPFGSGRRMCLGLPLVDRIVPLTVATLIHEFDWKLEPGVKQQHGINAIHNALPLMAIPIKVYVKD